MTAPVIPQVTQDTSGRFMDDVLSSIASESVKASLPAEPAVEAPKAPESKPAVPASAREDGAEWNAAANRWMKDGKFVAGEAPQEVEQVEAPAEPAPEVEPDAEPVIPEGFAAVPKIEGRELATAFKVMDAQGELEVPDITITFNAAGKERKEPLDKVVKLAQWGYANMERDQKNEQTRVHAETVQRQNETLTSELQRLNAERERLLSDPDFLISTLAQFEQQNTPEAKLQRIEQERKQEKEQNEFRQIQETGTQFFNTEIVPAVETITKALPLVSEEEIGAKFLLISDRFKVQTPFGVAVVPPSQYAAVRQAVLNELVPWAEQVHATRESDKRSATNDIETKRKEAEAKAQAAQTSAQKAKRLVGRVVKPGTGTKAPVAGSTREAPAQKPIVTVQDAEAAALREALSATLGNSAA